MIRLIENRMNIKIKLNTMKLRFNIACILLFSNLAAGCNSWNLYELLHGPSVSGSGGGFKIISAGRFHTLAIKPDGSLWAWGYDGSGQLGDNYVCFSNPLGICDRPVFIDPGPWQLVSAGANFSLGIKTDGSLWSWGYNFEGELGNGTNVNSPIPVFIDPGPWETVSAGDTHSLGIKKNNGVFTMSLFAWGNNASGQLGNSDPLLLNQYTPVDVLANGTQWLSVSAGGNHSMGIQVGNTLWTWGSNNFGQLGNNSTFPSSAPVQISAGTWYSISAGYDYSLAIQLPAKSLWAWGNNVYAQCGDPTSFGLTLTVPTEIMPGTTWQSVSADDDHSLGIKSDGTLWAWGDNLVGQLGDVATAGSFSASPILIDNGSWDSISTGGYVPALPSMPTSFSTGIGKDGSLWMWGDNSFGQLGLGDQTQRNVPTLITGAGKP